MSAATGVTHQRSAVAVKVGTIFTIANQGQVSTSWQHTGNAAKYRLKAIWPANGDSQLTLELQDEQRAVLSTWHIPHATNKYQLFLEASNASLELQELNPNDGVMLAKLYLCFDTSPQARENVRYLFGAVQKVVEKLPDSQVPYFNLGHKRPLTIQSRSHVRYNLRQIAIPVESMFNQPWGIYLPIAGVQIKLTKWLAHPVVRRALTYWTSGRIPAFFSRTPLADPLQASSHTPRVLQDVTREAEEASGAMSHPRVCADCHKDETPLGIGAIKNKRSRSKWVGCTNGEDCLSDNYWYHFSCSDADLSRMKSLGKTWQWVCPECRIDWAGTRLRNGMYAQ